MTDAAFRGTAVAHKLRLRQTIGDAYRAAARALVAAALLILGLAAVATALIRLVHAMAEAAAAVVSDRMWRFLLEIAVGLVLYGIILAILAVRAHGLAADQERRRVRLVPAFGARELRYFLMVASYLAATFCLAVGLGLVSGALFAAASDATFDGIAERVGYYSAAALWPGCMVLAVPFAIVALPMIAAGDARWPVGRALRASARNWMRLLAIWVAILLPLAALWFVVLVLDRAALAPLHLPLLNRWVIDIANLAAVAVLAAASSRIYRRLIGREESDVASVFD